MSLATQLRRDLMLLEASTRSALVVLCIFGISDLEYSILASNKTNNSIEIGNIHSCIHHKTLSTVFDTVNIWL